MHIYWKLLNTCNYNCGYCPYPSLSEDSIFVKKHLFTVAKKILEFGDRSFQLTIYGGEPTLHPFLPDLVRYYLIAQRDIGLVLETNASRDVKYYNNLISYMPSYSFKLIINAHPAYADLKNLLLIIASMAEHKQNALVKLNLDLPNIDGARQIADACINLRKK